MLLNATPATIAAFSVPAPFRPNASPALKITFYTMAPAKCALSTAFPVPPLPQEIVAKPASQGFTSRNRQAHAEHVPMAPRPARFQQSSNASKATIFSTLHAFTA